MVSIIIPIYNADKYLNECFLSIRNQTYSNFEVICIDDGSTDSSMQICEDWCNKDSRFKLLKQENQGVSVARNSGIEVAKGDYLCFVDADDMLAPEHINLLVNCISNKDLALCDYTRCINDLGKGGNKNKLFSPVELAHAIIYEKIKHPNIVCFIYLNSIIKDNNLRFTVGCVRNEDTEFFLKYITFCKSKIIQNDYKGYFYRVNFLSETKSSITLKTLTSIEASRRIGISLEEKGFVKDGSLELSNGVLAYAYFLAKENNSELYNYLHSNYNVRASMKDMLFYPVRKKKMVSLFYLLFGRKTFFYIISSFFKIVK